MRKRKVRSRLRRGKVKDRTANSFFINCVKDVSNSLVNTECSPKNRDSSLRKLASLNEKRESCNTAQGIRPTRMSTVYKVRPRTKEAPAESHDFYKTFTSNACTFPKEKRFSYKLPDTDSPMTILPSTNPK